MALRAPQPLDVPAAMEPRAQRMLATALRCGRIVDLALADDGGALTVGEAERRHAALLELDRAARRAVVAACGRPFGPPAGG
jgi:hypothetical protein